MAGNGEVALAEGSEGKKKEEEESSRGNSPNLPKQAGGGSFSERKTRRFILSG